MEQTVSYECSDLLLVVEDVAGPGVDRDGGMVVYDLVGAELCVACIVSF
jgi:hypothetical protein